MELIDNRGLANAGVSRNEHQLRSAAGYHPLEGGQQGVDFGCSSVQFLGNQQPVRRVVFTKQKFVDAVLPFPLSKAATKITLRAGCRLIALLRSLGEQLHDDGRNRAWNALQ